MRLVLDIEATGAQRNKANPYDPRNLMCLVGIKNIDTNERKIFKIEYDEEPYGNNLLLLSNILDSCKLLVGFNLKYDLAWLRRYRVPIPSDCRLFDCQTAYFLLTGLKELYPSLQGVSEHYGHEGKEDVVKTEYWEKGLDTNEVPLDILTSYLERDLDATQEVYENITNELSKSPKEFQTLVSLYMQDLAVLHDMEYNGLKINVKKSLEKGDKILERIEEIHDVFRKLSGYEWFNLASRDHVSALLYGGVVEIDGKEDYVFTYKDGRTTLKTRNTRVPIVFKGLFRPLEKSELAKAGFYSTDESTLVKVRECHTDNLHVIDLLLECAKLAKLVGTYYHGFPKKLEYYNWQEDMIHTSFNQSVSASGRLSSTNPNVQNIVGEYKEIVISRFKNKAR